MMICKLDWIVYGDDEALSDDIPAFAIWRGALNEAGMPLQCPVAAPGDGWRLVEAMIHLHARLARCEFHLRSCWSVPRMEAGSSTVTQAGKVAGGLE